MPDDSDENPEIIEPIACPTVYCSGIKTAVVSKGELQLLWFADQPGVNGVERVVTLRTVMRVEAIPEARRLVDAALKAWRRKMDA